MDGVRNSRPALQQAHPYFNSTPMSMLRQAATWSRYREVLITSSMQPSQARSVHLVPQLQHALHVCCDCAVAVVAQQILDSYLWHPCTAAPGKGSVSWQRGYSRTRQAGTNCRHSSDADDKFEQANTKMQQSAVGDIQWQVWERDKLTIVLLPLFMSSQNEVCQPGCNLLGLCQIHPSAATTRQQTRAQKNTPENA